MISSALFVRLCGVFIPLTGLPRTRVCDISIGQVHMEDGGSACETAEPRPSERQRKNRRKNKAVGQAKFLDETVEAKNS